MLLKWRLFDKCNFKCSYCVNNTNRKYKSEMPINFDRLLSFAKSIHKLIEKEKVVDLELVGGEITLLPINDLFTLIKEVYSKNIRSIHITSNFSANIEYYLSILKLCDELNVKFKLVVSFHDEMIKYDYFMNKAIKFAKVCKFFCVEFVRTHENDAFYKKIKKDCQDNNINLIIDCNRKEVWEFDDIECDENIKDKMRINLKTYGVICSNSIHTISIFPQGEVYGISCKNKRILGYVNMIKEFPHESCICKQNVCSYCGKLEIKNKDNQVMFSNLNGEYYNNELINNHNLEVKHV